MIKSPYKPEYWFIFQNGHLLLLMSQEDSLLTPLHVTDLLPSCSHQFLLGQFDAFDAYCAELLPEWPIPFPIQPVPFRKALDLLGSSWYEIATKAFAIVQWDKNHQYCGRCGNPTVEKKGIFERHCMICGQIFYPRISPSVIVLIHKEDHLLMARSPHFSPGAYGLIAGFVEAGESCETAVHREVKEEVGIRIKHLQYFGSQPWPFPDSLIIAYTAEYDSGEIVIDHQEIEAAGWYRFDQLPGRPSTRISMASKLIDHFIAQHTAKKEK